MKQKYSCFALAISVLNRRGFTTIIAFTMMDRSIVITIPATSNPWFEAESNSVEGLSPYF
ncbi:MAG: hypothetical protein ABJH85_13785 [Paracoccaceae bacterium]